MNTPIVCRDLSKRFRAMQAVDRLNLEIPQGAIYALVGPNGAGKTTAIKMMMNILQPDAGHAEILGALSRTLGAADFAQIGYVSENQVLPGWMTVGYFMSYLKPFYPRWDDARAEELLRQFDLPRNRKLQHLSRGMWMKASLASSLAYHPRLLVLDEPFSGLDPLVRDDLIQGILESADETTILVSSHDLAEIESFASHIGYMQQGRLRFSEEMTALNARFREIEVVVDGPANILAAYPAHWLQVETSPALVRFVDSRFDPHSTPAEIRRHFPDMKNISTSPMPLRAIFLTLARDASKAA